MRKSAKSRAEASFAPARPKENQVLKEARQARNEKAELTAKLRALRLSKEAEDAQVQQKSPTSAGSGRRRAKKKEANDT